MPQKEKVKKIPRDDKEQPIGPDNKREQELRKKRHQDILKDLDEVIEEAEKLRKRGRKGGQ